MINRDYLYCYRFSTSTFRLTSLTNSVTQFSTEADLEQVWVLYIFLRDLSKLRSSLLTFLTAVSRLGLGCFPYDRVDRYRKSE